MPQSFPTQWLAIIQRIVPYYHCLSPQDQSELQKLIVVYEGLQPHLGESWFRGAIVLSWDDALQGASDIHDGHNLVYLEFTHQFDNESETVKGAPRLPKPSMYIA